MLVGHFEFNDGKRSVILKGVILKGFDCSYVDNVADMRNERNKLLRDVTAELQDFCESNQLHFQMVDLRWGVGEEMTLDSNVISIYREQINDCHRLSSGPFLAVGSFYTVVLFSFLNRRPTEGLT
jgi:hypothetical protein